jgi:serine/threonine-protein kinase
VGSIDLARAMQVFEQVADLTGAARETLLDELCAGDTALREKVVSMVAADASTRDPFDTHSERWSGVLDAAIDGSALIGRVIGTWKIVAVAGRGGMGNVYEVARADGAYAQRAALKLIRAAADSAVVRERFLRERQILAQLRHPGIATLLDGGFTDEGDPYFVMEYVEGAPIDRWCDEHGLGLRARAELFAQVLDAVSYAHRNLLVHRDLKPSNLLVDAGGRVKLLDFGVAKQLQDSELTAIADRAVTFGFASPEQLNDEPITTATDTWQLGVLLHLLLSGSHPFGIARNMSLARQLQQLSREPEIANVLRGSLATVVATCLRRDPAARYASVDALAADLRSWLENRPVLAAHVGRAERALLWFRRNRLLATGLAAVTFALVASSAVSLWQAREARRESVKARESLQFLADTLAAAAPEQALNREVSVRQLLDSARLQLDQRSVLDPKVRQPVQRMLGRLYFSVGESQRAAELLEAGTRNVEPDRRDEALALADDLGVYSDALANLEQGAASVEMSDRAAALRNRFAPDDPEQQLRALAHQTLGHVQKFGWEVCRKRAERALASALSMPNPPTDVVLRLYSDLGSVANFTNDRTRLLQASEQGLAFADQHGISPQSPLRFSLLRNRIEGLNLDGRVIEAEAVSREAIAMIEKTGGVGSTRLGVLYSTLGASLKDQGRYREAQAALQRAFELTPRIDAGPMNIATLVANLALTHAEMGDRETSLRLVEQAFREMKNASVPREDTLRVSLDKKLAEALLADGRVTEAAARFTELRALVRRTQGEDSDQYAALLSDEVLAARDAGDVERGEKLLAEARVRAAARGVTPMHPQSARFLRYEAAFAGMRGDLLAAERTQREALGKLQLLSNTFEIAVVRSELAHTLAARGNRSEALELLAQALPVLQRAVLPQQVDLEAAEALASRLKR